MDLVRGKILLQLANELPKALSTFSYRAGKRTIELPVEEELPVLGIEAHHIARQYIDGEIRRELQDIRAGVPRNALAVIACHEAGMHAATPVALQTVLTN
jgi:hypothetical protein